MFSSPRTSTSARFAVRTYHVLGLAWPPGWNKPEVIVVTLGGLDECLDRCFFVVHKRRMLGPRFGCSQITICCGLPIVYSASLLWLVFCLPPLTTPCRVVVGILAEHRQRWYPVDSSAACIRAADQQKQVRKGRSMLQTSKGQQKCTSVPDFRRNNGSLQLGGVQWTSPRRFTHSFDSLNFGSNANL